MLLKLGALLATLLAAIGSECPSSLPPTDQAHTSNFHEHTWAIHEEERTLVEPMRMEMLQQRLDISPVAAEDQRLRAESLKPVAWLHVPKCGSFVFNTIYHVPGICELPLDLIFTHRFFAEHNSLMCGKDAFMEEGGRAFGDHSGVGDVYAQHVAGHGVVMLRQPEQRIISGYNMYFHSWSFAFHGRWPESLQEYAADVSGCAVKMLTRSQLSDGGGWYDISACGDPEPATSEESTLALKRLREGHVFVGLTEDYDLSVCLFRTMFGGSCHDFDFMEHDVGPPSANNDEFPPEVPPIPKSTDDPSLYNTTELGDFRDVHDALLYEEARLIFAQNLERYNVSLVSCQPCFREAGLVTQ